MDDLKKMQEMASNGDLESQKSLALLYEIGLVDGVNHAEALKWWLAAANQGDAWAQTNVANLYAKGLGTEPDIETSKLWEDKAKEQGYSRANIGNEKDFGSERYANAKKVLFVDDEEEIRDLIQEELEDKGYKIVLAKDGLEAFELLNNDDDIGLAIVDIKMPKYGGLELIKKIRSSANHCWLPIVVLSGHGNFNDAAKADQYGIQYWLQKPDGFSEISGIIKTYFGVPQTKIHAQEFSQKILHVDDNPVILELVKDVLVSQGYDLIQARDGSEGMEKLMTHQDIGLLLTDIKMPNCGGIEFIEKVRQTPAVKDLPVIVFSGLGTIEDSMVADKLGIQDWLLQPRGLEKLEDAVNKVIKKAV